jgi:hypothetical protein
MRLDVVAGKMVFVTSGLNAPALGILWQPVQAIALQGAVNRSRGNLDGAMAL